MLETFNKSFTRNVDEIDLNTWSCDKRALGRLMKLTCQNSELYVFGLIYSFDSTTVTILDTWGKHLQRRVASSISAEVTVPMS